MEAAAGEREEGEGSRQKRHRSRNFTKYEKEVFYSVFSRYAGIINDKRSSVDSIREAWNHLLQEYNSQHNVYPRTRRQLQVLWRDEKFRAKKRVKKDNVSGEEEDEEEEERKPSGLLSPLLTVIKREHEAFTAAAAAAAAAAARRRPSSAEGEGGSPCSTTRSAQPSPPSPQLCINSNTEEGPASPLPVETQLESCSSGSPLIKQEEEEEEEEEEDSAHFPGYRLRPSPQHWLHANGTVAAAAAAHTTDSEERDREYHTARMAQLREEGAARLRLLEAELALHHQERHIRQQEHQLRMQILVEKLRRLREGRQNT